MDASLARAHHDYAVLAAVVTVVMMRASVVAATITTHGINHAAGKYRCDGNCNNQFDCSHGTTLLVDFEMLP